MYEKAADLFQSESKDIESANWCRLKIAECAAHLEQYLKAIEIYEDMARQSPKSRDRSHVLNGHLLSAGICHLCNGDTVSLTNALEKYEDMYPKFSGTREYKLLSELACAIDEEDVGSFTTKVDEFNEMRTLDGWKMVLFRRVIDKLEALDDDDDDLT